MRRTGVATIRSGVVALALVVFAALAAGATVLVGRYGPWDGGTVYSVSQVASGLRSHPARWLGRTVRVRAVTRDFICPAGCTYPGASALSMLRSGAILPRLFDGGPHAGGTGGPLLITVGQRGAFLDMLARLPAIGGLVPGQRIAWHGEAVYRLRIRARPCIVGHFYCYEGVLVDAVATDPLAR